MLGFFTNKGLNMKVNGKTVDKWKKTSFMIDDKLWSYAQQYAKENKTTVSFMINQYLTDLIKENAPHILRDVYHKDQLTFFEVEK